MTPQPGELEEVLTEHWTQLLATALQYHIVVHDDNRHGKFEDCWARICVRAHEVAAKADALLDLESKAAAVRVEMNAALHAFAETLPDESEPVS